MADTDDDVPPLEDMSELVAKVEALKLEQSLKKEWSTNGTAATQLSPSSGSKGNEKLGNLASHQSSKTKPHTAIPLQQKPAMKFDRNKTSPEVVKASESSFGGFKKGFLFSSPAKPPQKSRQEPLQDDGIPFIKPSVSKEKQYEMPEVQAAMEASQKLVENKDNWLTEDLLKKVSNNPTLCKRLMDPSFMQAVAEFQSNPQAAMMKYQDNPEMQSFIKDFCGILGHHFTSMSDPSESSTQSIVTTDTEKKADISVVKSSNPRQATADDERRMQEILTDSEIRPILQDPRIQRLFEVLRTDPDKAQRILQSPDPDMARMVRKLCEAGLLQFQK